MIPGVFYFVNVFPEQFFPWMSPIIVLAVAVQLVVVALLVLARFREHACAVGCSLFVRLGLVAALVPVSDSVVTAFIGVKGQFLVLAALVALVPALWIGPSVIRSYAEYLLRLPSTTARGYEVLEGFAAPVIWRTGGARWLPTIWLLLSLAAAVMWICIQPFGEAIDPERSNWALMATMVLMLLGLDGRAGFLPRAKECLAPFDAVVIWLCGKDVQDEAERPQVVWRRWLPVSLVCLSCVVAGALPNYQELRSHLDGATLSVRGFERLVLFLFCCGCSTSFLVPCAIVLFSGVHRAIWLKGCADRLK